MPASVNHTTRFTRLPAITILIRTRILPIVTRILLMRSRITRILPILIGIILTASLPCAAQRRGKLPDSIPGSQENTSSTIVDTAAALTDTARDMIASDTTSTNSSSDSSNSENASTPHDSVAFRRVPDSVIRQLKRDKDFAYANDPSYWSVDKKAPENFRFIRFLVELLQSKSFLYCIYGLLAAILCYALYKIISENNLRFFDRKGARVGGEAAEGADLAEEDLDEGLKKALLARDHRLATRYLYLLSLRLLDSRRWIRYHPQTTNEEYLSQVGALPQEAAFRFLTRAYERVWYGDFAISDSQFALLMQYFQDFYKSIPTRA